MTLVRHFRGASPMSRIQARHFGIFLLVVGGLAVASGHVPLVDGPLAADKAPKADKPGDSSRIPPSRKPRVPSPPMKDLRLKDEEELAEEQILQTLSKPTEVSFDEM